jgi:hypothetical protein
MQHLKHFHRRRRRHTSYPVGLSAVVDSECNLPDCSQLRSTKGC